MRASVSSPILFDVDGVDAEAGHEALVAQDVDRRLADGVRFRKPILALAASSPSVAAAHSPISLPASKLSVAKVASAASTGQAACRAR